MKLSFHRLVARTLLYVVVFVFAFSSVSVCWADDDVEVRANQISSAFEAVHGQLDDLERRFGAEAFESTEQGPVQWWVDARLFFDSGEYSRAAFILSGIIDDPEFKNTGNYRQGLLLLGRSLYEQGDNEGAKRNFDKLFNLGVSPSQMSDLLYYLIDSTLKLQLYSEVEPYLAALKGAAIPSTDLRYVAGKAHFFLGNYREAADLLKGIPTADVLFARSRYYLGAVRAMTGDLDEAEVAFRDVVDTVEGVGDEDEVRLLDLSRMAMARLALERGEWVLAVGMYQKIPMESPQYSRAMYELGWAYANQGKMPEALRVFQNLQLAASDERLMLTAGMDRGRILTEMGRYEDAQEAFEAVTQQFLPIRDELEEFSSSKGNIAKYFDWLIHRYDDDLALESPLSERAAGWIEGGESLQKMLATFNGVAENRKAIEELEQIVEDLDRALKGKERNELFPSLGDAWVNLLAVENGLIMTKRRVLRFQRQLYEGRLSETRTQALEDLYLRVERMEADFDALPKNSVSYRSRLKKDEQRFDEVQREAFHVSRALIDLRNELLAIDKFIKDMSYSQDADGNPRRVPEDVRLEMQREKARAMRVAASLDRVDKELRSEMARIGLGGDTYRSEEELKARMLSLYQGMEGFFLGSDDISRKMKEIHERIWADLERVAVIQDKIHEELDTTAAGLLASVKAEVALLKKYRVRLDALDRSCTKLARKAGKKLFKAAKRRIDKEVLQADLGIIDLAWERRQELTEELSALSAERAEKISKVQNELEDLMSGPEYTPLADKPLPGSAGQDSEGGAAGESGADEEAGGEASGEEGGEASGEEGGEASGEEGGEEGGGEAP